MSAKKFFQRQKEKSNLRSLTKGNIDQLSSSVESEEHVKQHIEKVDYFVPDVDYSNPENFVKYGSAVQYYADSIKRIYGQYPYDGSEAEKLDFFNNQTPLEKYIFDQKYPKSTGYVKFDADAYITVKAGPHKKNLFNTASNHVNNLQWDLTKGNTIEFWLRKAVFNDDPTPETVLYLTASTSDYFETFLTASQPSKIQINTNYAGSQLSLDTGLSTILDDKWHHYAIVLSSDAVETAVTAKLYTDGQHTDTQTYDSYSGSFNPLKATLGARIDSTQGLTASMDEFRFWRSARTGKEIGRNYIAPVHGGSNTDKNKYYHNSDFDKRLVDLGVYFKFNEGMTGDSNQDSLVLDYSGRVSNGSWSTYSAALRSTGSAIVESGVAEIEEPDPIIYAIHPDVLALSTELAYSGTVHDETNNASLYNTIPQWIREEDETTQNVLKLTQIMGSYLDTLYGQISEVSNLKSVSPVSASGGTRMNKPLPFTKRLLTSLGFDISDVFIDKEVIEEILSRSEKKIYETELHEIKNLIYKNIYNNLTFINKSKGTEKSLRNLFRCYGVDDDLININIYADGVEYTLDNTIKTTTTKKNLIDFSGIQRESDRSATVYQYPLTTSDYGYISASFGDVDIPFSAQAEVVFPDFDPTTLVQLTTSSIFGCHTVTASAGGTDTTWAASDLDFQLYAVKADDLRTYFMVTSSNGTFPELTSSQYFDVYDNTKWNFVVRLRPEQYPLSSDITSSVNHLFEFYGVNVENGVVFNEFSLSSSVSTVTAGQFLTGSNKKFYAGSHRTNFTGSVLEQSDVRLSSLRVWNDYLTNEEVQLHAKDPENYGRKNPLQHSFLFEGNTKNNFIPKIDTLALKWDFAVITGSDASGRFDVLDTTSGSSMLNQRYPSNNYGLVTKNNHTGRADFFDPSSANVYTVGFLPTSRQTLPENVHSSDMVNVLSQDDQAFNREGKSVNHYFAIEMSMNQLLSKEMLNFFASVDDFSNQIGEPVHRYRDKYKGLEKLRNLFFERVQNTPDADKFLKLYKWLDTALDSAINNLIPLSAQTSQEVVNIVESHVLERNKNPRHFFKIKEIDTEQKINQTGGKTYTAIDETKVISLPKEPTVDIPNIPTSIKNIKENWADNHAPPTIASYPEKEFENAGWWASKAEQDRGKLDVSTHVNTTRTQLWLNKVISTISQSISYELDSDIIKNISKQNENHIWDFYKKFVHTTDATKDGLVVEFLDDVVSELGEPLKHDNSLTGSKREMPVKVKSMQDGAFEYSNKVLPFKIMSSSVENPELTGLDQNVDIVHMHRDIYKPSYELPAQGPFTEENVGGSLYRHGQLLVTSSERMEGFHIKPATSTISVFGPRNTNGTILNNKPNGALYRDNVAKSPVNIKNISGKNFSNGYEVVSINGRTDNNRHFIKTNGALPSGAASQYFNFKYSGTDVYEFEIPRRDLTGSNKNIIVNRFSSRGGSRVESEGKLDIEAGEYSAYNAMNYQNLDVKNALNELYKRYTEIHGADSIYGSPSDPFQAFHKVHRNSLRRIHPPSGVRAEEVHDNLWINNAIPRMDTSYRWINSSWLLQVINPRPDQANELDDYNLEGESFPSSLTSEEFLLLFGFEYATESLPLVSQSQIGASFSPLVSPNTYLPTVRVSNDDDLLGGDSIENNLNSYLSNINGPYQHPSWKQTRVADHIIARVQRDNNFFKSDREVYDSTINNVRTKRTSTQQSPISQKQRPIQQEINDFKVEYSFDYQKFGLSYDEDKGRIVDINREFGFQTVPNKEQTFYDMINKTEWNRITYSETIYPRDENAFRSVSRNRDLTLYDTQNAYWNDDISIRQTTLKNTQFSQITSGTTSLSSWLMDTDSDFSGNEDQSGELMKYDNSTFITAAFSVTGSDPLIDGTGPTDNVYAKYGRNYQTSSRPFNLVHTQAGTGAFYNSYAEFIQDVRLMEQGYGILPEFSISDNVRGVGTRHNFDFYQDIYEIEVPGGSVLNIDKKKFYETYSHTDTISNLGEMKNNLGEPTKIKISIDGILKLLPKEGFYPVQRTLQLATLFSQSYGPTSTIAGTQGSWRTLLNPFYAPGIMYNSIKSGIAVDYPIIDGEVQGSTRPNNDATVGYTKRLPFETILEPDLYSKKVKGNTAGLNLSIYEHDLDIPLQSTGTLVGTDNVYENASHNFFAESAEFFNENTITTCVSENPQQWQFNDLSSSAGIKKWAMNVVIEKTSNFTMHDAPKYFGFKPYVNHLPPYYPIAGIYSDSGEPDSNVIPNLAHESNKAYAQIIFDPTSIANEDPDKFRSGKFTFEDILANSTIIYINDSYSSDAPAMKIDASVNIFQKDKHGRWVIGTKWETPILNFASVSAQSIGGTGDGSTAEDPHRGMWHQYGEDCASNEGLFLRIADLNNTVANKALTGSLAEAVGFKQRRKRIGEIKKQHQISEAVVAIPFFLDANGDEKFFDISLEQFEKAYQKEEVDNSITDMIVKMRKYVNIPQFDFVRIRDKSRAPIKHKKEYHPALPPFATYIFEFEHTLQREDLKKIWQGVMPEISVTAEKMGVDLEHAIESGELISPESLRDMGLSSIPEQIRWKVFKIKKKAKKNYFKMRDEVYNSENNYEDRHTHGFNWPYDYFSLVETGKVEVGFCFDNDNKMEKTNKKQDEDILKIEEFETMADADSRARELGCMGSHIHSSGKYMPCKDHQTYLKILENKTK